MPDMPDMQTQAEIFASLGAGDIVKVRTREIPGVLPSYGMTMRVLLTLHPDGSGSYHPDRRDVKWVHESPIVDFLHAFLHLGPDGRVCLDSYFMGRRASPECHITKEQ